MGGRLSCGLEHPFLVVHIFVCHLLLCITRLTLQWLITSYYGCRDLFFFVLAAVPGVLSAVAVSPPGEVVVTTTGSTNG